MKTQSFKEVIFEERLRSPFKFDSNSGVKLTLGNEELNRVASAFSKHHVIVTSQEGTIYFIDMDTMTLSHHILKAHLGTTRGLVISNDSEWFVTASADKTIKFWNFDKRELLHTIPDAHLAPIHDLLLAKQETQLVSLAFEVNIKIWDIASKTLVFTIVMLATPLSTAINKAATVCVFALSTKGYILYDLDLKKEITSLKNIHDGWITAIKFTPDEQCTVTASADRSIKVYHIERKKPMIVINDVHTSEIYAMTVTQNEKFIISASFDNTIRFSDFKTGNLIYSFEDVHTGGMMSCCLYEGDRYLITTSVDKAISKIHIETPQVSYSVEKSTGLTVSLDIAPDGKYVVLATFDLLISLFELTTKMLVHRFVKAHDSFIKATVFFSDSQHFVSGASDRAIKIWDAKEKRLVTEKKEAHKNNVFTLVCTKDMKKVISGSWDLSVKIWEVGKNFTSLEIIHNLENVHPHYINHVGLSGDEKYFFVSSLDKTVSIWNLDPPKLHHTLIGMHTGAINCSAITSDSRYLVTAGDDKIVNVVDFEKKKVIHKFENFHRLPIKQIALSPDNAFIVSISNDSTIQIYSLEGFNHLYGFILPNEEAVNKVKFTPDSNHFVGGAEKAVKVFNNPFKTKEISIFFSGFISPLSILGELMLKRFFLSNDSEKLKLILNYPSAHVYPYDWNFFHIICLYFPKKKLLQCLIKQKIPFYLDQTKNSPIHYLIKRNKRELVGANYLIENFNNLTFSKHSEIKIIKSLTNCLIRILKLDSPQVAKFLKRCLKAPKLDQNEDSDIFGTIVNKQSHVYYRSPSVKFTKELVNRLIKDEGNHQIMVYLIPFGFNYNASSKDMLNLMDVLENIENPDIFKTKLISILINYLWKKNRKFHYFRAFLYSCWIILLSFYTAQPDSFVGIESTIVGIGIFFLSYEILELLFSGVKGYGNFWNFLDMATDGFIAGSFAAILFGLEPETKQKLLAISVLLGYWKWIEFFRVFDSTRRFMTIMINIVREMQSFLFILSLLIIGFSLIFYQLGKTPDNQGEFSSSLLEVYSILYGNFEAQDINESQMFFFVLVTALLSVVMLNMLIAIMTDSFNKTLLQKQMIECKEKIALIKESIVMKRGLKKILRKREADYKKEYLFYAEVKASLDEHDFEEEIENSKINSSKSLNNKDDREEMIQLQNRLELLQEGQEKMKEIIKGTEKRNLEIEEKITKLGEYFAFTRNSARDYQISSNKKITLKNADISDVKDDTSGEKQ